jgi:hypothetical protein
MDSPTSQPVSASFLPIHFVRDIKHPLFRAEEKAVLFAIASRMRDRNATAWPTLETIASDAGVNKDTAMSVVKWALAIGVLVLVGDGRRGRVYQFDCERMTGLPLDIPRRTSGKANASRSDGAAVSIRPGGTMVRPGRMEHPARSDGASDPVGRTDSTVIAFADDQTDAEVIRPGGIGHPTRWVTPSDPVGAKKKEEEEREEEREQVVVVEVKPETVDLEHAPKTPRSGTLPSPSFALMPVEAKPAAAPKAKRASKPKLPDVTVESLSPIELKVHDAIVNDQTLSRICVNIPSLARDLVQASGGKVDVVDEVGKAARWNRSTPAKAWTAPRGGNRGLVSWIERQAKGGYGTPGHAGTLPGLSATKPVVTPPSPLGAYKLPPMQIGDSPIALSKTMLGMFDPAKLAAANKRA